MRALLPNTGRLANAAVGQADEALSGTDAGKRPTPAVELSAEALRLVQRRPVATLATVDADAEPTVIPICFVYQSGRLYTPIDDKRKRVSWGRLKRLRNIEGNPKVSVLVEEYSKDWSQLAYVLFHGLAEALLPQGPFAREHRSAVQSFHDKYAQYRSSTIDRRPIIRIIPSRARHWTAS